MVILTCALFHCGPGYECVDGDCILIDVALGMYITGTNHTIVIDGSQWILEKIP